MERLVRYEILAELGRGAMGVVHKARDPELDRLVALKVMLPPPGMELAALQQRKDRCQREGRAAARLTHPNIVTVHDVGEDQGHAFLVMELLEGQSLDQLLRVRDALPLDQVVTIGEQVARALDYAHRNGIIHRDVKPSNILLTSDGVVKITDFGIARITGETFTQFGQDVGTPSYMSPEQVAGLKVDGRSDLFSLGVVLYELITGDKAFPGDTIGTITYRIIHEDPTPLRRLNPAYPAALDACLKKTLAKDPARRPTTATIQRRGRDNAEMVFIPAGTFTMGDTHGDGESDEKPAHQVRLDAFWLDRTEVTNAQFARFVQAGNTAQGNWQQYASGKDQHPVVSVTWNDAGAYCRRAGKRLPTEAEWEYAARGADGGKYPWGNTWEGSRARFGGNRGNETTAPVGSYPTGTSPFGVLDMAGNVWEWVQEWYGPYSSGAVRNPTGASSEGRRVLLGGSWLNVPWYLRSADRNRLDPAVWSGNIGFRCAQGS
jgi:serine/threonine-protein kinase